MKDTLSNENPDQPEAESGSSAPTCSAPFRCERCGNQFNAHQCPVCYGHLGPTLHMDGNLNGDPDGKPHGKPDGKPDGHLEVVSCFAVLPNDGE